LLKEHEIEFVYREYTQDPLSEDELRSVLAKLGLSASAVFRKREAVGKELGLKGNEPDDVLIPHMALHPTLLQRPIGVVGERAAMGRPVEGLLALVRDPS
jgi:arsenate reductase (glutaredoxin)